MLVNGYSRTTENRKISFVLRVEELWTEIVARERLSSPIIAIYCFHDLLSYCPRKICGGKGKEDECVGSRKLISSHSRMFSIGVS